MPKPKQTAPGEASILAGESPGAPSSFGLGGFAPGLAGLPAAPGFRWQGENPYRTPLSPHEEQQFQTWFQANRHIPVVGNWRDTPQSDYDMRGYWKDMASRQSGLPGSAPMSNGLHLTDMYKTPYHQSFSRESQYSASDGPTWHGSEAEGWQLIDKNGQVLVDERKLKRVKPKGKR